MSEAKLDHDESIIQVESVETSSGFRLAAVTSKVLVLYSRPPDSIWIDITPPRKNPPSSSEMVEV